MEEKIYEIKSEFYRLDRRIPIAVYRPSEPSERSQIAVLAMHGADYLSFEPVMELAKHGFTTAGANPQSSSIKDRMLDVKAAVDFMRQYPGIRKVVLMGHSNGGCLSSCYQYIAENGTGRFANTVRIVPFPEIEPLTPADGLMLLDANYGIMEVLPMDPAVKSLDNGYERIPELDIYNPDNGYDPAGSHYDRGFVRRFQRAQIQFYKKLLDYARERADLIKMGKGRFADDEPIVIPGAGSGSGANKLFIQDVSLLGHTRGEHKLLHRGGVITSEVIRTVRTPHDAPSPSLYHRGSTMMTVNSLLAGEIKFDDDFGYDECSMWGADWNFNPFSTRANVQGIHVPLLVEGNTASHEFIQAEYNYELSASEDKDLVFLEGATHMFRPQDEKYGNTLETFGVYMAQWLAKPGRFLS